MNRDVVGNSGEPVELYRESVERVNGRGPAWLRDLRRHGIETFRELGFPTTRLEDWKYTNVAPIANTRFRLSGTGPIPAAERVRAYHVESAFELVFVNGRQVDALSSLRPLPNGTRVTSLSQALEEAPERIAARLGRVTPIEGQAFTALNTAFLDDGAAILLDEGAVVPGAIHLLFVSTVDGSPTVSHPRVLVVAGPGSRATIVETHLGLDGDVYFTNAVTEIALEADAAVEHVRLQLESGAAYHVGRVEAEQGPSSRFVSRSISLGALLARIDVNTTMAAEGSECVLDGLYMASGTQHVDHHTAIDHRVPRCRSRELYKGVLGGRSKGVFNGKVWIRIDAQQSDAHQANKNLLLSDDAEVDTKPQLEIFADDVRCSHGATVGRLDQDAIFYLRSRGIEEKDARDLLVYGFANEIVDRIRVEGLRARLEDVLHARLRGGGHIGGAR